MKAYIIEVLPTKKMDVTLISTPGYRIFQDAQRFIEMRRDNDDDRWERNINRAKKKTIHNIPKIISYNYFLSTILS